jgi:predicted acyltransferase
MKDRIISVDVLRGLTVLLMTIVNNPGSWSYVYPILDHAKWNGCTLADLVFPFFIFIVGIAVPLAMPIKKDNSENRTKIITRSLRIICLGMFLGYFYSIHFMGLQPGLLLLCIRLTFTALVGYALIGDFKLKTKTILAVGIFIILLGLAYSGHENFAKIRLFGVLQRIGIVYFFVSIIYLKTNIKTQIILSILILMGYWALMTLIPVPGIGYPNLEAGTNLASWLDSVLLKNHMYIETKTWDPEGILSTLPVIANGLIGLLIGQLLIQPMPKIKITKIMASVSFGLIIMGLLWSLAFPINKALWTSSYVLFTAGTALLILSVIYYIIDVLGYKKWTPFLLSWGVNPMIVFFVSGILPRALTMIKIQDPANIGDKISVRDYAYNFWISPLFENQMVSSLTYSILYIILWSCALWYFYKKGIIFKV